MTKREFLRWMGATLAVSAAPRFLAGPGGSATVLAQDVPTGASKWAAPPVTIHEWGTFTSLQDMAGNTLGGINADVEALPSFVYQDYRGGVVRAQNLMTRPMKAPGPGIDQNVTMRLETPVLYVHGDADALADWRLNVQVQFVDGKLSQFFPWAAGTAETDGRSTSLQWKSLRMSKKAELPKTDMEVWLAPRRVDALDLTVDEPEPKEDQARGYHASLKAGDPLSERYLFYRGIGTQHGVLKVSWQHDADVKVATSQTGRISISVAKNEETARLLRYAGSADCKIQELWLIDVNAKGGLAWKPMSGFSISEAAARPTEASKKPDRTEAQSTVDTKFSSADYSVARAAELKVAMRDALVKDGLNKDEADAMLATWDAAYFKTPGMRIFYITPKAWAEAFLPLLVSLDEAGEFAKRKASSPRHAIPAAAVSRSMIGRIELVTPEMQRAVDEVANITEAEVETSFNLIESAVDKNPKLQEAMQSPAPYGPHAYRGVAKLPRRFVAYLDLGRFRTALLANAVKGAPENEKAGARKLLSINR